MHTYLSSGMQSATNAGKSYDILAAGGLLSLIHAGRDDPLSSYVVTEGRCIGPFQARWSENAEDEFRTGV